ncbi:MAG: DUF2934 domain-containing protein [Candidatus Udaeobacter sp.]
MKKTNHSKAELVPGLDSNSNQKEQIAQRAYELWEQRGCEHGNDWCDWFEAEIEIKNQTAAKD